MTQKRKKPMASKRKTRPPMQPLQAWAVVDKTGVLGCIRWTRKSAREECWPDETVRQVRITEVRKKVEPKPTEEKSK